MLRARTHARIPPDSCTPSGMCAGNVFIGAIGSDLLELAPGRVCDPSVKPRRPGEELAVSNSGDDARQVPALRARFEIAGALSSCRPLGQEDTRPAVKGEWRHQLQCLVAGLVRTRARMHTHPPDSCTGTCAGNVLLAQLDRTYELAPGRVGDTSVKPDPGRSLPFRILVTLGRFLR